MQAVQLPFGKICKVAAAERCFSETRIIASMTRPLWERGGGGQASIAGISLNLSVCVRYDDMCESLDGGKSLPCVNILAEP